MAKLPVQASLSYSRVPWSREIDAYQALVINKSNHQVSFINPHFQSNAQCNALAFLIDLKA
jgi:hypothetical protein